MTSEQKNIIGVAVKAAAACGVIIGPGLDAAPLMAIWIAGYFSLASEAGFNVDREFIAGFVKVVFVGFVEWYISGKIAQMVVAAIAALVASAILFPILVPIVFVVTMLGSNAIINAVFTNRFLTAAAEIMTSSSRADEIVSQKAQNYIISNLFKVSGLGDEIRRTIEAFLR